MEQTSGALGKSRGWALALGVFAAALVLAFSIGIRVKVDVDEHAFVTSGALFRDGLLPYRDYHYNHMPTQVMVYSLLFRMTDHLLLAARLFQSICAAALAAAVFHFAFGAFAGLGARRQRSFSLCVALLMATHPLYTRTAGLSWNHDFPTLMMVGSFLVLARALATRAGLGALLAVAAGLLAGLSVTGRLTFAPALLPLVLWVLLHPGLTRARRLLVLAWALGGFAIACLPSAWVWAQAPGDAFFGNFLYPRLNTAYHARMEPRPTSFLRIFFQYYLGMWFALPGTGITAIAFIALTGGTLRWRLVRVDPRQCILLAFVLATVLMIAAGCMPAPPYPQYFYAATPFMILAITVCVAERPGLFDLPWARNAALVALAFIAGLGAVQYRGIVLLPRVSRWTAMRAHAIGREMAALAGPGQIMTLEPIYAVEGGLDVVPELTTSRFILRTAHFLPEEQRKRYKMIMPEDLRGLFLTRRIAGVLIVLAVDKRLDGVETTAAAEFGYRPVRLKSSPEGALWLPVPPAVDSRVPRGELENYNRR